MNINTITSDNVIGLLKEVTDNTLHEKIIQLAANNKASSSNVVEKSKNEFEYSSPYSLSEVNNRLSKQHVVIHDTSFDDLQGEIEHITTKGFSATYKDRDISHTFIIDPISRDINALINIKQKHVDSLQLEIFNNFSDDDIPTKSCPCQMNAELVEFCKKEIDNLLQKGLIKPSKSTWSCTAFYVNNAAKKNAGKVTPIQRSIDFASKSPDVIIERTQLQRFLESLNYISPFYKNLSRDVAPMDPPWETKARGRGSYTLERGRSSSKSSGSSYGSSSSSPIIQTGGMNLVKLTKEVASSIHLNDILENNPLYAQLQAYLSQNQSDIFASVAKEEDIKSYEKVLIYNNERHKHTWFIKVCAKIFAEPIPNWFLNWWSYHGPTTKILPDPFLKLYNKWDGNKQEMINNYLHESDTLMQSETSDDVVDIQEAQLCEPTTEDVLEKAVDLLRKLKGKDHV
ncbi:hypothetical protein H5410_001980 [Solanum commersonii]|uniref:Uncharacterized protein n=1 Tax=Solanum commersonii TaxID=4109 RepID=A0A9J6B1L5_SOLCO|nr:hypothetical protein H5410_001980 [Solanum commersonii]